MLPNTLQAKEVIRQPTSWTVGPRWRTPNGHNCATHPIRMTEHLRLSDTCRTDSRRGGGDHPALKGYNGQIQMRTEARGQEAWTPDRPGKSPQAAEAIAQQKEVLSDSPTGAARLRVRTSFSGKSLYPIPISTIGKIGELERMSS